MPTTKLTQLHGLIGVDFITADTLLDFTLLTALDFT